MKLIRLSCSESTFRTLEFNLEGVTLIVGDGGNSKLEDGNSNGVGKTLSLGLVHHCLGASIDKKLKAQIPNWIFTLEFIHNGNTYVVDRSIDGRYLRLNGSKISNVKYSAWLNEANIFRIQDDIPIISFRSLVKIFGRYHREDCLDPLKIKKEVDFASQLRTLYLLGLDCYLAINKRDNKVELDRLDSTLKNWKKDNSSLAKIFRAGNQPKVRTEFLEREITRFKVDLEKFQIAEDYRIIEKEANDLSKTVHSYDKEIGIIQFQLDGIKNALKVQPDISKDDLLRLYKGLEQAFKPEMLNHFDAVQKFHTSLATNRKSRLEKDSLELKIKLESLTNKRSEAGKERDKKLQGLQGKKALDEYAEIVRTISQYEDEKANIDAYLNFADEIKAKIQVIKEEDLEKEKLATQYLQSDPISEFDKIFAELAAIFYPQLASGIVINNNTGKNQLRYDLAIQIQGDDSDGINAARIICFDWMVFLHGANHSMEWLWHDNRLFADIDPRSRAAWFSYVINSLGSTKKQYIAAINIENYQASLPFLGEDEKDILEKSIRLVLKGDTPSNKLLGVQFG